MTKVNEMEQRRQQKIKEIGDSSCDGSGASGGGPWERKVRPVGKEVTHRNQARIRKIRVRRYKREGRSLKQKLRRELRKKSGKKSNGEINREVELVRESSVTIQVRAGAAPGIDRGHPRGNSVR